MQEVRETAELRRVRALPRRAPACPPGFAEELTSCLRHSTGGNEGTLRATQALGLHDIMLCGGAFCALDVGEGKTLLALLASYVLGAVHPILLVPANLVKKTTRDRDRLSEHWRIQKTLRVLSYEILGRVQAANELDVYKPDLIIADECQKLRNPRAAVTRRVSRWMDNNPGTKFVALTGSIMRKSLMNFAHLLAWCLKEGAPVPLNHEVDEWAAALDEDMEQGNELARFEAGALLTFCSPEELARDIPLVAARRGFRRRLLETPGVIATIGEGVAGAGLAATKVDSVVHINSIQYAMKPSTERAFHKLRSLWLSPADDWPLNSGNEVWADAKELALGLTYTWDPRPPEEWLEPRREWGSFVRKVISFSRTYDSEQQIAQAVTSGRIDDGGRLTRWLAVRDTFIPNTVPVWFDDSVLHLCAAWARQSSGLIWTEHSHFAARLSRETGLAYYGPKGLDAKGRFIDDAPEGSAIVSSDANREGRNLQGKWSRNLITSAAEGSDWWNQLIGRTHRPGQQDEVVTVDVLLGCAEHANAWRKALAGALAVRDTTGAASKLLSAKVFWPSDIEIASFKGPRWRELEDDVFEAYLRAA